MSRDLPSYCQHFQYLKISESLSIEKEPSCKFCFTSSNLWICLSKNCMVVVCGKNNLEHLNSHLQQTRKIKKFHSVFINPNTTEIRCIQCNIEIGDFDIPPNIHIKNKLDPFHYRVKLLPGLADLINPKIVGQLQNSQGHKKISKGLVGLFPSKYNYSINTAIQFIYHCKFIKDVIFQIQIDKNNKILLALRGLLEEMQEASFRAIISDSVTELLFKEIPTLYGYKRKDPFEIILFFLSLVDDETLFYSLAQNHQNEDLDQWDLFYRKQAVKANHLAISAIQSTISLNYRCQKCNKELSVPHNIKFIKLNIPKKKRKVKQVQKELESHRYSSPVKNRRKSLMNLFKEVQCPITIPQLIIQLMKSPIHKELNCQCGEPFTKTKLHFLQLPDILIIQIARISKDGNNIDKTPVEFSTASLDLGPFTDKPQEEIIYDFQSAICIEKGCLFPIVVIGQYNHQPYVIRNQIVQLSKQKMNPYILCYRKRLSASAQQKVTEIQDNLSINQKKNYILPDFYYLQLKHGIQRPFKNQFVCKHNFLKPNIESKMKSPLLVSSYVYEDLLNFYLPEKIVELKIRNSNNEELSPKLTEKMQGKSNIYINQICQSCSEEAEELNLRRKKQKQFVLMYDRLKGVNLPYCMISAAWISKWSNYLYNRQNCPYMPKGYPLPPLIDNKVLLEGNKCKNNLVRNEDFKIVNIYLWKFLKELYGGGPQIRYKWKEGRDHLDEDMIADIKSQVVELKLIFRSSMDSPKKLMTSLSFIEKSSILQEGVQSPSRRHQMIQQIQELNLQEINKE